MTNMEGVIFDIQRWSLHDGPGIRTNVFMKGCPLSCQWCSNPESQARYRELAFFKDKCIGCLCCIKNCPYDAISQTETGRVIDHKKCREFCSAGGEEAFACAKECYSQALEVLGRRMTAEKVMEEVLRDRELYRKSGGGITITGGEPFAQPEFLLELLRLSRENGLHTTIETSLFADWNVVEKALSDLDFLFMDFKLLDTEKHRQYTGAGNERILDNMKRVSHYKRTHELEVVVRTPVIPGVNDDLETIGGIAEWIRNNLPEVRCYQLLPYHRLGRGKYDNLGKRYNLADLEAPGKEQMKQLEKRIEETGLTVSRY